MRRAVTLYGNIFTAHADVNTVQAISCNVFHHRLKTQTFDCVLDVVLEGTHTSVCRLRQPRLSCVFLDPFGKNNVNLCPVGVEIMLHEHRMIDHFQTFGDKFFQITAKELAHGSLVQA